jgi:hypothetical protein
LTAISSTAVNRSCPQTSDDEFWKTTRELPGACHLQSIEKSADEAP